MVFFVTYYHKGYSIQDSTKIIHRYLPREVGELLVYYLWLVVPFLNRISLKVFQKPLSKYLFKDLSRKRYKAYSKISGDQFRTIFRRETLSGLGLALNPSEYRHIAIGISRRFLSKNLEFQPEDPAGLEDEDIDYEDDIITPRNGSGLTRRVTGRVRVGSGFLGRVTKSAKTRPETRPDGGLSG